MNNYDPWSLEYQLRWWIHIHLERGIDGRFYATPESAALLQNWLNRRLPFQVKIWCEEGRYRLAFTCEVVRNRKARKKKGSP